MPAPKELVQRVEFFGTGPQRQPDQGVYSVHDPGQRESRVGEPREEKEMKIDERNINNNPTGKPFCCFHGCGKDATLDIQNVTPKGEMPYDHHYQSCGEHVLPLLGKGGFVSPIGPRGLRMTPDLLAIIEESKRLDSAARLGPWGWVTNWDCPGELKGCFVVANTGRVADVTSRGPDRQEGAQANAEFISHARTALPALVAEVERLQRVVDQAVEIGRVVGINPMDETLFLLHSSVLYPRTDYPDLYEELKAREGE